MDGPQAGAGSISDDRLRSIHQKISIPPRILCPSAGKPACCIFRVPRTFVEINGRAYRPRIVSIGPYHIGHSDLAMIQEHKYRYLDAVLARSRPSLLSLESLVRSLEPMIGEAIECYSESISLSMDDFLEMLVVDSVFLIELFMRFSRQVPLDREDPIFTMSWVRPFFNRDFLCLENQIPYFILEKVYNEVTTMDDKCVPSLARLALVFFNNGLDLPGEATAASDDLPPRHLLDLVRTTFLPHDESLVEPPRGPGVPTHVIHCVSKLRRAGIHLRASKDEETFLAVRFREGKGLLEMPMIAIDDLMAAFLMNCVAYEQCHHGITKHFTTYATLLDCLVNTARDVEYMCDHGIVENHFGTDSEVARLINNMGKDVAFNIDRCYLSGLFNSVHDYYNNSWHVQWAGFKYTYFDTPWSFISALAALVLLFLALTQTFFTVYQYYFPPK
ncbi:hypothetical protein MLD38_012303 [Melastoma candidum]|uniref:Uncharacterized protein n=1 Tax=Melastoma candidum TaxID=119954 RepID=A0ACB9R5H4_9MYRT|nr:hypothetical protein MLD38_012303 [Melastoma candidum]